MPQAQQLLQQHFGFSQFRPGQQQAIDTLLAGQSAAAIFPTGSGKSLCYQLPALALPHLTLVISPLLALMQDQLAFLHSKGIPAATIDSTQSYDESQAVMNAARAGQLKVLMISVERLKNERFRRFIGQVPLSLLVVDEAHCISEWGHNFRPDYLKLPRYCQQLNIPQVLLLTATATPKVIEDMASKFAIPSGNIVTTGFYRANLDLSVEAVAPEQREATLLRYLDTRRHRPGIIYVTQQQTAEVLASKLAAAGHKVSAYHAGLEHPQRQGIQQRFMAGQLDLIVATIAFGMGVDKADIRLVVHYDLPKSVENYSQEIGRAGRDGQPSECLVMANLANRSVLENFVYGDTPERAGIERVLEEIAQAGNQWELMGNALSKASNIRPLPLRTLLVYLEMAGVIEPQYSYFAEVKFKLLVEVSELLARFQGERRVFLEALLAHSPKGRTWYQADFEALYQAYGAERNRAMAAIEYLADRGLVELQSKQMTEVYRVHQPLPPMEALAQQLLQQFEQKELSEVQRIEQMLALLQAPDCLSHALAHYFGDGQAPTACGHCSACRHQPAQLQPMPELPLPEPATVQSWLQPLQQTITNQCHTALTATLAARFLVGLPSPWLTQVKARQLTGYGALAEVPYAQVRQLASQCLT
ncbi:RecQ family ATP-dependent DNA helicase [Ferrimonas marina]|uniref:ATP-dependent DNA helicase RecQ n=1 Tax=Ferrimonas marina TaxID=299255 RepID=A0A1M5ZEU3_9GAMM|nr:RecQ family ATP-dependent DNA helicase [Ferrimonas marina]SHI22679.1 ATP-dependent DNA helicase RecQ [Ferrimonas marina]